MSSEAMFEIFVTIFGLILKASWLMLPAYMANPTAVVFGGGTPVDMGKNWKDGRRIFGDGKTFRGLIGGTIAALSWVLSDAGHATAQSWDVHFRIDIHALFWRSSWRYGKKLF